VKKLYITYCSAKKRSGLHPPDKLYISDRITRFIERCRAEDVDWAIFSALHAFVFPDKEKIDYNTTFRSVKNYWLGIAVVQDEHKLSCLQSKQHILQLIDSLKRQASEHEIDQIVLYGPSPKMMKCYLAVLHYAFDECSESHGWRDLIEHIRDQSKTINVLHRLGNIR